MTSANPYGTGSASPPARPATSSASGPPGAELPGAGPPRTATPRPAAQRARVPGTGTDNQVITGEAVALDLAPASALSRLMSGVIDLILYASTGAAVLILATGFAANDAQLNTMAIVAFALTMVVLPTAVETLTRGLSAGRLAVGLRIVRDDGGPVQFRQALIRALAGIGEIWLSLGAVALITSIIHPRGKRLGDLVAGTYSLRVRESETARAPLLMPAELRPWAEIVDLGRIPDALALQARVYLSRTGDLHPWCAPTWGAGSPRRWSRTSPRRHRGAPTRSGSWPLCWSRAGTGPTSPVWPPPGGSRRRPTGCAPCRSRSTSTPEPAGPHSLVRHSPARQ